MFKYYVAIVLIWITSIGLIIAGFLFVGTPVSQQKIQLDRTRLTHFSYLRSEIISYYQDHDNLPTSLSELSSRSSTNMRTDPETHKEYTYMRRSDTAYALCTTFSLDAKDAEIESYLYQEEELNYKKGYSCVEYSLPSYTRRSTPTPTIPRRPLLPSLDPVTSNDIKREVVNNTLQTTIRGTYSHRLDTDLISIKVSKKSGGEDFVQIAYNRGLTTQLINKAGSPIDVTGFRQGDVVVVTSPYALGDAYIASKIQDLTR